MSKRAEERALDAYPVNMTPLNYKDLIEQFGGKTEIDVNTYPRRLFQQGYEQAEKDLAPAFEFPFDVPDNDGHIVFTPMDNMTIRKELKLKKGERVIVSIRKEYEKE